MKRILILLFLSHGIILHGQSLNIPLLIGGKVHSSNGDVIADGKLHFTIFLKDFPEIFLTENSFSCGYNPPVWHAELGNLNSSWAIGDSLIITFEYFRGMEKVTTQWIIAKDGEVEDVFLQPVETKDVITAFKLSDFGVFGNNPLSFDFEVSLGELSDFSLKIFDSNGSRVFSSNAPFHAEANIYRFIWDGKTSSHAQLKSGVYYYFLFFRKNPIHSGAVSIKNE